MAEQLVSCVESGKKIKIYITLKAFAFFVTSSFTIPLVAATRTCWPTRTFVWKSVFNHWCLYRREWKNNEGKKRDRSSVFEKRNERVFYDSTGVNVPLDTVEPSVGFGRSGQRYHIFLWSVSSGADIESPRFQ